MTRKAPLVLAALAAIGLAGCEQSPEQDNGVASAPIEDAAPSAAPSAEALAELAGATPMAERVATIGLLNKRNNLTTDIELSPGESAEEGPVIVTLAACERTAPHEFPQETGAFVQVDVRERGEDDHTRIFSGWLFRQNPSLNVVEHPIYDVWVKECAMRFPGEE
ncbi:DUF2155 domain-containing protein [Qipengyuania nanhaisediminis]|uniref:DUF2155 domain-containing protein n=1 Tax=Qipengyuania nanhaisediminis TaxID=604088 RepID=UPI0038B29568